MKIIKREIDSSFFKNEKRDLIIWEPKNINKDTPIIFIYDGQILKTGLNEFNQNDGIEIFKHLKNVIGKVVLITINSMNSSDKNKYNKRAKELTYFLNNDYVFMKKIRDEIKKLKLQYKGIWLGIGFSLSAWLIGKEKIFDQRVMISPCLKDIDNLSRDTIVFYGSKEYRFLSKSKINNKIEKLKSKNNNINFLEIKNMKHTFSSWNNYFEIMLKASIKPFIEFKKLNIIGVGKFQNGNSNIIFKNKNYLMKIKANKIDNIGHEKAFIQNTKYKNEYKFVDKQIFIKEHSKGKNIKTLNNTQIKNLALELKELHKIPIDKKIPIYNENPLNDELVMSHGDLNYKNIIFNNNKPVLIDFEWARLNSKWWDICSIFISFSLIEKEKELFLKYYGSKDNKKAIKIMTKHLKEIERIFFAHNKEYFSIL